MSECDQNQYVITFQCPDQVGVVARFSQLFYDYGCFISEISQYSDPHSNRFFSRTVFDDRTLRYGLENLKGAIAQLARELAMEYQLRAVCDVPRTVIAVSKYDHCLSALLTKWRAGVLPTDIVAIVSNHSDCEAMANWYDLPFFHWPVNKENKAEQEAKLLALMEEQQVDLLVLARYMQILSDGLCDQLKGRAINIHHSFLPGFKGAKPYHQAYERGVKVIGATAHYVTADLDEGPIIVQEVKPVDHRTTVEDMVHKGHDIEAAALAEAVRLHLEQRIVLNGERTVIL